MKRQLLAILTIILLATLLTACGSTASTNGSKGLEYSPISDGYAVTGIGTCSESRITIPSSYKGKAVTAIGDSAFDDCTGLNSITIPDSVTSIGSSAFSRCTSLTNITVAAGNTVYHSAGNCIIKTTAKTLIKGCKNSTIPNDGSVTVIGDFAFYGCAGLTSITIPDGVEEIGYSAFYGCTGLTSITIPDGVEKIKNAAFDGCTSLESITIPHSVRSIGKCAFRDCTRLTSIHYDGICARWSYFIEKEVSWDYKTGKYTVYCTDGEIKKRS